MVASLPELTMRTNSIDGNSSLIFSAMRVSISVGAPKLQVFFSRLFNGGYNLGMSMPSIIGPQEPT